MFKVWDKLFDGLYDLRIVKVRFVENGFKLIKESVYLIHIMASGLLKTPSNWKRYMSIFSPGT